MVAEQWMSGQRAFASFGEQRMKKFGCLRPQWAKTFLASLTKQANMWRGVKMDIEDTHRDYFLNPCACVEHCREEGEITTPISGSPINCSQHRLNLIEFEVFDRTGTRSFERYCQDPLT
jgi:hypothetical protein